MPVTEPVYCTLENGDEPFASTTTQPNAETFSETNDGYAVPGEDHNEEADNHTYSKLTHGK